MTRSADTGSGTFTPGEQHRLGGTEEELADTVLFGGPDLDAVEQQLAVAEVRGAHPEAGRIVLDLMTSWGPATRCFTLGVEPGGDYSLAEADC